MKIGLIHAEHWTDRQGGGELTTKYWLDQAPVQVDWVHNKTKEFSCDHDFYLIGDFPNFKNKLYFKHVLKAPHAFICHNSISWVDYFPGIYNQGKFAITLAPDHAKQLRLPIQDIYVTAPYVDYTKFKKTTAKEKAKLYLGQVHPLKIPDNMIDIMHKNPKTEYHIYGSGDRFFTLPNVIFFDSVDYTQANVIYGKYKTFFWRLNRYGCYGRTLVEALLSGMELDVNKENFGLFKFSWIHQGRQAIIDNLENYRKRFWSDIIDKIQAYL